MSGTLPKTRRFFASALLGATILASTSNLLAQTDEQRAGARSLATEGAQAFNEGRFKDAVDLFGKAESLVHAPPHLLFMARAHAKLGQFVRAREAYMKIVKEQLPPNAPQAFRDAQAAAEDERKQVEPHIGRLTIKIEGAETAKDLNVAVDGQPVATVLLGVPQPMDPGNHTVTATATGFKAAPASVALKDAGQGAVTLKMEVDDSVPPPVAAGPAVTPTSTSVTMAPVPASPSDGGSHGSNGLRIGSYVGFGVGVAGLALGTVFVLKSAGSRSDADKATTALEATGCSATGGHPACDATSPAAQHVASLDKDAKNAQTIAIVGYVVGGVGVAAGVTLFVLSMNKDKQSSAYVAPYVGPGAFGLRGAF
ncbi:MAG TPA: hypothetical protein VEQ59_08065 [Polyangiaceae bacterium]|nr:hypothetical protein [Polyangiaceae bacterium]